MMPYLLILICPVLAALAAGLIRHPNLRDGTQLALAGVLVARVIALLPLHLGGTLAPLTLFEPLPGVRIFFSVDGFGLIFLLVVSALWLASLVYSIGYMRANGEHHQNRFYACFALAIFATCGIAMAGNMFTLFLFYEMLTLVTFPLVTHHGTAEARRAGRTYLAFLLGTSMVLLTAIVWTQSLAGSTDFTHGGLLPGDIAPTTTGLLLLLYTIGIGKTALMPFHHWLPAAMVAPAPVSALLHAVAVVKAGVFTLLKVVVLVFGTEHLRNASAFDWRAGSWLMAVAGITLVLASVIALRQDSLKKRLAYSTISQLAYIVLALAMFTPVGVLAAAFHLAAHAFGKVTLFFAAGSIATASGKHLVSELDGIGRRMPWTMGAFAIGTLSMIGLPPAAGFLSKYVILQGAVLSHHWGIIVLMAISTLLNAIYFLPILYAAFFRMEKITKGKKKVSHGEAPWPCVVATCFAATMTILLFLWPGVIINLAGVALKGQV